MIFDMETDMRNVRQYANLVCLLATGIRSHDKDAGDAIERLGIDLRDTADRLGEAYDELFHAVREAA